MKLKSPFGMSPTGVGPIIYASAIPFIVLGCLFPTYKVNFLFQFIGLCLILLGIIIFILTMIQLIIKFNEGKLATTGAFSISRNPLYSCWILLIIPGLSLLCLNWWFILGSISMGITLNIFIKKEENMLLDAFGQEYLNYKKEVNRII